MNETAAPIRFGVPKGRMYDQVVRLLNEAGIEVRGTSRGYRPRIGIPGFETKILKPRAIVEMLAEGARDLGFAGSDWVAESGYDLVEVLDTGLDPVRLVAAAPEGLLTADNKLPDRPLIVASEYVELGQRWIEAQGLDAKLLRSYGATEVLPPEDADVIIDNTATGATLVANGLRIFDELMGSSTKLYASSAAMEDEQKRASIDTFAMLLRSVLEARSRVMIELNVTKNDLERVVSELECMREPTISMLHAEAGFAVKAAIKRDSLTRVIPRIKARGGTDIVVSQLGQIIP